MKIAVVGKGNVGGGLADLWEKANHDVTRLGKEGGDVSDSDTVLVAVPGGDLAEALHVPGRSEGRGAMPSRIRPSPGPRRDRGELGQSPQPLRDEFARAGSPAAACARFLGLVPGIGGDAASLQTLPAASLVSVAVHGGTATVGLAAPSAKPTALSLEFSEGEWKIDSAPPA